MRGWPSWEGDKIAAALCARAPALVAGKSAPGAGRAPARVLPAAGAAGRLLFLSWRLDLRHVAVLARPPELKEREPESGCIPQPRAGLRAATASRCLRAAGTRALPRCPPGPPFV